jgi:hypothetical protein
MFFFISFRSEGMAGVFTDDPYADDDPYLNIRHLESTQELNDPEHNTEIKDFVDKQTKRFSKGLTMATQIMLMRQHYKCGALPSSDDRIRKLRNTDSTIKSLRKPRRKHLIEQGSRPSSTYAEMNPRPPPGGRFGAMAREFTQGSKSAMNDGLKFDDAEEKRSSIGPVRYRPPRTAVGSNPPQSPGPGSYYRTKSVPLSGVFSFNICL